MKKLALKKKKSKFVKVKNCVPYCNIIEKKMFLVIKVKSKYGAEKIKLKKKKLKKFVILKKL